MTAMEAQPTPKEIEKMDAKSVVSALIAEHVTETSLRRLDKEHRAGFWAAMVHAAMLAYSMTEDEANEYVAEECQERFASQV